MLLEAILDLYEKSPEYEKQRRPGSGNPTGSALGKCAAQMQLLRYPSLSTPEAMPARAIMGFEEGRDVEQRMLARARRAYGDGLVGSEQALAYWPVPDVPAQQQTEIIERMTRGYGVPGAIWGKTVRGFRSPRVRITEEGRAVIRPSAPIAVERRTGFILDPEAGTLWVPIFIDFALRHPDLGPHIVEVKAVSEYEFRRALMGDMSYQKRAQLAAMVEAIGLPALWLIQRKNTQHILEVSYTPSVAGKVKVQLLLNTRREEIFLVDVATRQVSRETGEVVDGLPADEEWTCGQVWTPHDPAILAECRDRVLKVLLWEPGRPLDREYGVSFVCAKCGGVGTRPCGTCKGSGVTAKLKKTCGPCGGAKVLPCDPCEGRGQLDEATLPSFPCGYCPVALTACYKPAGAELQMRPGRFGQKPVKIIRRAAWEASGLSFTTPPSLRPADVTEPVVPAENGAT